MMATYKGIGCMSGSSLDGLDMCCVEFTGDIDNDIWGYRILKAQTLPYTRDWQERLENAINLSGIDLIKLHVDYGNFIGNAVISFMAQNSISTVDFVASHGHTIFHQPDKKLTFQLGEGETTASHLTFPFVCNFRSKDVALGGQGAPLVPCGEKYLFSSNEICINLGGIANIGLKGLTGYDICPCNMILNHLATEYDGQQYDKDGKIAASGKVIPEVMEALENLPYYKVLPPKSLGRERIDEQVFPVVNTKQHSIPDLMRTFVEHIATRIADACAQSRDGIVKGRRSSSSSSSSLSFSDVLITGGGAFNKFLVNRIREKLQANDLGIEEADEDTINFKEALIFAFLGLRSLLGIDNITCDVTGSSSDSVSGSIHRPLQATEVSPSKNEKFTFQLRRQRSVSS